jgi:hypothetical protein
MVLLYVKMGLASISSGEACELVDDICGCFTEGFDTVGLVEAKALLEELA